MIYNIAICSMHAIYTCNLMLAISMHKHYISSLDPSSSPVEAYNIYIYVCMCMGYMYIVDMHAHACRSIACHATDYIY